MAAKTLDWTRRIAVTAAAVLLSFMVIDAQQPGSTGEGTTAAPAAVDPLLDQQWHLKSRSIEPVGANVVPEWTTTRGAGIVIGVVGDGLDATHPDLQPNYLPSASFDFNSNDSDPTPAPGQNIGTAAAGISGARDDNGVGGAGAAPRASLAGLRLTGAAATDQQEADAFAYLPDTIHIQSHAWHRTDNGATLTGPGPLAAAALQSAATTARSGKGRIFVFGAGDGRASGDDCNFDGYANRRHVIAVGAVTDGSQQAAYSEFCSALLVSAGSSGGSRGLTTTDLSGGYTSSFGGTSGAASTVSGVVALMLARNPNLTWRDVQHILRRTSVRINPGDVSWTPGAFPHSERFGFGLVDAQAAASMAATWTSVPPEQSLAPVSRTPNLAIPDADTTGITDSIAIDAIEPGFLIEHVEVEFSATHEWRGDLHVTLTSPAGVVSTLAPSRPSDSGDNFTSWRFTSARHWGESPTGTWTLRVADGHPTFTGTWTGWTLRIYGAHAPAPAVSTGAATNVTLTTATLNGTVNPNGISTTASFEFGLTTGYGSSVGASSPGSGTAPVAVSASIAGLTCGTVYHFRTAATNSSGTTFGNDGMFTTSTCPGANSFTDDPLVPGVTVIKAVHVTELRQRVNAVRANCGLGAFSWTDPTLSPRVALVRAVHVSELRTALTQAYTACKRSAPSFSDPTLVPQVTPARAVHITELRNAVRAIE